MTDVLQTPPDDRVGDEDLVSIVYASTATVPFTEADLALLLAVSRSNNEAHGVTGVLLSRNGQFMQALEGPQHAVRATLARIAADPRHTGVWILDEEQVADRRFGSWAMSHSPLADSETAAAPEWFGSPEAVAQPDDGRVGELLAWFRAR